MSWISCKEKQPEESGWYVVIKSDGTKSGMFCWGDEQKGDSWCDVLFECHNLRPKPILWNEESKRSYFDKSIMLSLEYKQHCEWLNTCSIEELRDYTNKITGRHF